MLKELQASAAANSVTRWSMPPRATLQSGSLPTDLTTAPPTSLPACSTPTPCGPTPVPTVAAPAAPTPASLPPTSSAAIPSSQPRPSAADPAKLLQLLLTNAARPCEDAISDLYVLFYQLQHVVSSPSIQAGIVKSNTIFCSPTFVCSTFVCIVGGLHTGSEPWQHAALCDATVDPAVFCC